MKVLVTGTAGFIGYHLINELAHLGHEIVGLDSINDYYGVEIKYSRLKETGLPREEINYNRITKSIKYDNYSFIKLDLEDKDNLKELFRNQRFDLVCNLAAQTGVKDSLVNPHRYINSNITGFVNVLECCRHNGINNLIYASSSSVYGLNKQMPFSIEHKTDRPITLYAVSKISNELMAHSYSHLYSLPTVGLRFFSVYGPWGRPDMVFSIFTKAILEGKEISVFNNGNIKRDFTFVKDVTKAIATIIDRKLKEKKSGSLYKLYNVGNGAPVNLMDCIENLESLLEKTAKKKFMPMQAGDMSVSWGDSKELKLDFGYKPSTDIKTGLVQFVEWYKGYYLNR
jgi:UDP-glucuronate 4-epimerase